MYKLLERFKNENGHIEYLYNNLSLNKVLEYLPKSIGNVNYARSYKQYNSAVVELYRGNKIIFSTSTLRGQIDTKNIIKLWMDSIRPNRSEKPSFLDRITLMNSIATMFEGEKIYSPSGELKSVKVKTIWGEPRYIVIHQLENLSEFSVDIYDYWSLLQTRTFKTKTALSPIAYEIGQYVTE